MGDELDLETAPSDAPLPDPPASVPVWRILVARWLGVGVVLAVVGSLASYAGTLHRALELTSHFKAHYLAAGLLATPFFWWTRSRPLVALGLICILMNAVAVVPWYWPRESVQAPPERTLRILLANLNASNDDHSAILRHVEREKPDVFVAVEVNRRWLTALRPIRKALPHAQELPRGDNFGIAIYSRLPLEDVVLKTFATVGVESWVARIRLGDRPVTLVATHPVPPIRADLSRSRNEHLAALAEFVRDQETPVVVVGDLNTTPWSPYYRRLERDSGLRNSREGHGLLPTWPARLWFLGIPIDHCLVSPAVRVIECRTLGGIGSDHLPLLTEVAVP